MNFDRMLESRAKRKRMEGEERLRNLNMTGVRYVERYLRVT